MEKANKLNLRDTLREYGVITLGTVLIAVGVYFFKFPNNFTFGGVTGMAVVLSKLLPFTATGITNTINMALLVLGFAFLGSGFGIKTVYVTLLNTLVLSLLEKLCPLTAPLTDQPVLEMVFAIFLPSAGAALLFNVGASGGGTDIVAMIIKKYSALDIGKALFLVDLLVTLSACVIFDITTALFSFCGLLAKTLVIDDVIESINMCKYCHVICDDPKPICAFINGTLHRGATVMEARGAFTGSRKYVIMAALKRNQAVTLRNYVRSVEPRAFILVTKSSEIIGKGFAVH